MSLTKALTLDLISKAAILAVQTDFGFYIVYRSFGIPILNPGFFRVFRVAS